MALSRERARHLPTRPGVYLWKDTAGRILYVGKAQNLRARVRQYFDAARLEPAKRDLMRRASEVETIVTKNDAEALALEATLIQRHEPPYNVRLVDDSSYLYVKITNDTVPRVELVRKVLNDGAWYRGPYPSALSIRRTLKEARRLFPWCSSPPLSRSPAATLSRSPKPCFAYHLGLCPGICAGKVTVEEYQQTIAGLKRFLDGDVREALQTLRLRMAAVSAAQDYERAAKLRDTLRAIERATTPQHVATPRRESADVLGLARTKQHAAVTILSVREGRVVGSRVFSLVVPLNQPKVEILRGFLLSYLPRTADGARQLLVPEETEDVTAIATVGAALRSPAEAAAKFGGFPAAGAHRGAPLHLITPRRGWKRRLLDLARTNAEEALRKTATELESPAALADALRDLARALHLPHPPRRIEAYDISNIQGTLATGSLVVFMDGKPKRSEYRKFKVALEGKPDDVAMMKEVLRRRLRHVQPPPLNGETSDGGRPPRDWPAPDLILVDGGKPQLQGAREVLHEHGCSIPLAALAKRDEELFVPGRKNPIVLPRTAPALFLVQRIRDEAHRFTLGYHQLLRKKRLTRSILEEIPGVGDATRKKLLRSFGSLRTVRAASREELARVVGEKLAGEITSFFNTPP